MSDDKKLGTDELQAKIAALEAEVDSLKAQQSRLEFLLDLMPGYVAFVGADRHFKYNNAGYQDWLPDKNLADMQDRHIQEVIGDEAFGIVSDHLEHVEAGSEFLFYGPVQYQQLGLRHLRIDYHPMIVNGDYQGFGALIEDFTERRREEDRARRAAVVFDSSPDAIVILNSHHEIVQVNAAFTELTGYSPSEVKGKRPWNLVAPGRQELDVIWDTMQRAGHWSGELWHRRKDGSVGGVWVEVNTVADNRGFIHNYVGVMSDLESKSNLSHLAHHDALTGLPNRLLLDARLEHTLERCNRTKGQAAVLFMDLDGFKDVNDAFGHDEGDLVLIQIAERFQQSVRAIDTVARLGGDEFVIILDQVNSVDDACEVADRVLKAMSTPIDVEDRHHNVGVSIGISTYPEDALDGHDLLRRADVAMYAAKKAGKGQWATYLPSLGDEKSIAN